MLTTFYRKLASRPQRNIDSPQDWESEVEDIFKQERKSLSKRESTTISSKHPLTLGVEGSKRDYYIKNNA